MRSNQAKNEISKTHKALVSKLLDSGTAYKETEKKSARFEEVRKFFDQLSGPQSHPGVKVEEIDLSQNDRKIDTSSSEFLALKESIKNQGLLQRPVLTLGLSVEKPFLCVAGHRRILACMELGQKVIPSELILTKGENDVRLARLAENIVRQNLEPLELANAVYRLREQLGENIQGVARILNKNRNYIARLCKIAQWPDEAKDIVVQGKLNQKQIISVAMKKLTDKEVIEELLKLKKLGEVKNATPCSTVSGESEKASFPEKNSIKLRSFFESRKLKEEEKQLIYGFLEEVKIKGWIPGNISER